MLVFKKMKDMLGPPSLKVRIHKELACYDEARDHKIVHASDLTKEDEFCPREFALADLLKVKRKGQFLSTSLMTTFDSGDAISDLVRTKWAVRHAIGTWECIYCGIKHKFTKRPKVCGENGCGSTSFRYHEESFWSNSCGAVGNLDMLADLNEPKHRVVEIKTIDKDFFKELVAPLAEHRLRTNLYLRMVEDSSHPCKNHINTKEGIILYVCRGFGIKDDTMEKLGIKGDNFSPFKEYFVQRDDSETQDSWDKASELKAFRENKKEKGKAFMPEGVCATGLTKRAKVCNCVKACFGGQYPVGGSV